MPSLPTSEYMYVFLLSSDTLNYYRLTLAYQIELSDTCLMKASLFSCAFVGNLS